MMVEFDVWFITPVKTKEAPNPKEAEAMSKMMAEAAQKLGVKIHQGPMTLGRYDASWISEAPDIGGPVTLGMMGGDARRYLLRGSEEVDDVAQ